jgi:hypothetical protein
MDFPIIDGLTMRGITFVFGADKSLWRDFQSLVECRRASHSRSSCRTSRPGRAINVVSFAKVRFGVLVNLAAYFQAILRRLDLHLGRDGLSYFIALAPAKAASCRRHRQDSMPREDSAQRPADGTTT